MERFDLDRLRPGSRDSFVLPIMRLPDGGELNLPVLAATGQADGPTLTVLAGVHGDEYEGIRAIPQIFRAFDLAELRGRLIMVPVCNVPAYRTATRSSPIDGLNLARAFPGDAHGTVTQRIAHILTEQVIAPASLLIDLHSAGVAYSMPTLVGYPYADTAHGRASREAALAFGCNVVWAHPPDPSAGGRTISAAEALGIPWIYTEAAGGGRTLPEDVKCYRNGVLNVLRCHLLGAGNTDAPIRVDTSGYFISEVALLDTVTTGHVLGHVLDFAGAPLETIRAHIDGRVVMIRGIPAIHAGAGAFLLSGELSEA